MKKDGATTVAADAYCSFIEEAVRTLLPSAETIRFRPANNFMDLAFNNPNDFLSAVIGAGSANIKCEAIAIFRGKHQHPKPFEMCVLRLELAANCIDSRLIIFIYELLDLRSAHAPLPQDMVDQIQSTAGNYEREISESRLGP